MTMAALMAATAMNAQVFIGGSIGFGSVKIGGADSETTYKVVPEIGYCFNEHWAIGIALGYQKGECSIKPDVSNYTQNVETEVFGVQPYARYTFTDWDMVNIFCDLGIGFASYKDLGTDFSVGLRPGASLALNDKLSFVTHIGFLGFETFSPKGDGKSSNAFGLDIDNSNLTFGLYYNF